MTLITAIVFVSMIGRYDIDRLVTAIDHHENSTLYPYGIRSIDTHGDRKVARQICLNTVRNTYKRWNRARNGSNSKTKPFLAYLAERYCPTDAINWEKGVRWFYNKGGDK